MDSGIFFALIICGPFLSHKIMRGNLAMDTPFLKDFLQMPA